MRNPPAFEHPGQLGEESPFTSYEDRHLRVRKLFFEVEAVDLLRYPFGFLSLLIEEVSIDSSLTARRE